MSRKLASIRTVKKLLPIPGADFIELALVDGWQCVVKKGAFKEGDKGVYFEIDSMLPDEERYSFLGKTRMDATGTGYHIKTIKLRGTLSQGLMLPFDMFDYFPVNEEGYDMTKELGVWLYERKQKEQKDRGLKRGAGMFPPFIPKTDQNRIQNVMHFFDVYKDMDWEVTFKLDGSSMTVWNYDDAPYLKAGKTGVKWKDNLLRIKEWVMKFIAPPATFGVCSRNINLLEQEGNQFWNMANELNFRELLRGHNVAIQGELIGPKIQNNHENVDKNEFYVFDIYDIDKQCYMSMGQRSRFMRNHLPGVKHVKTAGIGKVLRVYPTLDELQWYVTGPSQNEKGKREGFVFKSVDNPSISFKCISNEYLLKYQE